MDARAIALHRLAQQRLSRDPLDSPQEVVGWLGAVQAQDYSGAQWALGLRLRDAADDAVDRALAEGTILRTHVMRPTWHFVSPADIRWLLELTAPRVTVALASMNRRLELDDALLARSTSVLARALQGGQYLTRAELGAALAQEGIVAEGVRLAHVLFRAELEAVVCSGPRRGKQFTYGLLDERAPQARRLPRDEALAALTLRYYTGHGPATAQDFAWWSGLTVGDARAGLTLVGSQLVSEVVEGRTYWFPASLPAVPIPSSAAYLLPTYDEFLVGYAAFDKSRRGGQDALHDPVHTSPLVLGGRVAGSWRRTITRGVVEIAVAAFAPLADAEREAIAAAAGHYGAFLGLPVQFHVGERVC